MAEYEGIIEINRIANAGDRADEIGTLTARFVRYPGSQQLTVWLPESAWNGYGNIRLTDLHTQQVVEEKAVTSLINGSVMLLWDTLAWTPGDYLLEIEHPKEGKHELQLRKLVEGEVVPKEKTVEMDMATAEHPSLASDLLPTSSSNQPDSIQNNSANTDHQAEDLMIRAKALEAIKNIFVKKFEELNSPRIEYTGTVRAGSVTYIEGDIRIGFWHEMGGGDCKLFINVPTSDNWEAVTQTPLSRRDEILRFVANSVRREQAPSWRYEIRDNEIVYF